MSYSDYALIKKSTLTEIGDAIRSQKGTTKLIDPADFGSEISTIEASSSIEGGFTVNFHDTDGELIESHSAELGRDVYMPASYIAQYWANSDGRVYTFPLTCDEADKVFDLYDTSIDTCATAIYGACDVNKEEYPYLMVELVVTSAYYKPIRVYFLKSYYINDAEKIATTDGYLQSQEISNTIVTSSGGGDIPSVTQIIVDNAGKIVCTRYEDGGEFFTNTTTAAASIVVYTNFDEILSWGRLDQTLYIAESELHPYALQDKTVTESGVVTPDDEYYGLRSVTVNVEAGSSVEGGYVANFYDENGVLIQSISSKDGLLISPPDYECVAWSKNNSGIAAAFPVLLTENTDYYAITYGLTYADQLYAAAGLSRSEYPYILYNATRNSTEAGVKHTIRFAKSHEIVSSGSDNNIIYRDNVRYGDDLYHTEDYNIDFTNLEVMTRKAIEIISTLTPTYVEQASMGISATGSNNKYYRYVNHEYYNTTINYLYRLDTLVEPNEGEPETNPYALQEKTITENGDVIPDEGYYGLSRVSVNVESGASIDGGYIVNFYNPDNELIEFHGALFGYKINAPIDYSAEMWVDANGATSIFPLTILESDGITSLDLYAVGGESATYLINSTGTQYGDTFFSADGVPQSGDNTISDSGNSDLMLKSYDTVYSLHTGGRVNHSIIFNDLINCSGYKYLAVRYLYEHLDQTYNNASMHLVDTNTPSGSWGVPASSLKSLSLVDSSLSTVYYTTNYGDDYLNNEDAYRWATIALDDIDSFYLTFHSCSYNLYVADVKLVR